MDSVASLQAVWLALASSGFVLLGFSSVAASLAGNGDTELSRHQIFGVRAIVSNSLYLSVLALLPVLLAQASQDWDQICGPLGLSAVLDCQAGGHLWSGRTYTITSGAVLIALTWQVGMQLFRLPKTRSGHDVLRIALFYLVPVPFVFWTQLVNLEANSAALALFGVTFFAWAACGYFYLFLHAMGSDVLKS